MVHSLKRQTSRSWVHPNFPAHEFACKCGTGCGTGFANMEQSLLSVLYKVRDVTGLPMVITSAYRCPKHPESIRRPNSAHTRGYAVDFRVNTSQQAYTFMKVLFELGVRRMGWNQKLKFFHFDTDPTLPQEVLFPY